ncbi:MAG: archease [Candidatus Omnitrophica bacterium]|nr:archease [Candidatus Omnitrophota bacterium]
MKRNYQLIEHTADIGMKVKGRDLESLFVNAAKAMFEIIAQRKSTSKSKSTTVRIKQNADSIDELFINWLNELLSLSDARGLIFFDFKIKSIDTVSINADVFGNTAAQYRLKSEIKAATYHQLNLKKTDSSWVAEVIFDV